MGFDFALDVLAPRECLRRCPVVNNTRPHLL